MTENNDLSDYESLDEAPETEITQTTSLPTEQSAPPQASLPSQHLESEEEEASVDMPSDIAELESPTLVALAKSKDPHQPAENVACRKCKGAIWIRTGSNVLCFCTVMHLKVWESTDWMSYMQICDGKFLAEKQAQEEEERKNRE